MPLTLAGSLADQFRAGSTWQAVDYSYLSMNFDPAATVSNSTPISPAGTLIVLRVPVRKAMLVTNIVTYLTTAGATLTAGQCFAALYQGAALLAQTATQHTAWGTSGLKTAALSSPQWVGPQSPVDVVFWFNGTTGPALLRGASNGSTNLGKTLTALRTSTADTGRTTTAPSTLGAQTLAGTVYWAALS